MKEQAASAGKQYMKSAVEDSVSSMDADTQEKPDDHQARTTSGNR